MPDFPVSRRNWLIDELVFTITLLLSVPIFAQDTVDEERVEAKRFRAVHVNTAPVMDGRLDDEVWQQAHRVTDFHQNRPGDHAEPSEPTELYVVYTSDALYIAARMYDSEPELIAAPTIRHGQGLPFDDRLVIKHTSVSTDYAGQGVGKLLIQETVRYAKEKELKIVVVCSYAVKMKNKHPELFE